MDIRDINVEDINVLENIRQKPLGEDLSELMDSIKQQGLMQPIGVRKAGKGYILIWGFRRLNAFKKLGYKTIPASILVGKEDFSEEEFIMLNASENIHRSNISMIELGRIFNILQKNLSISEIAVKMGIPKSRVENALTEFRRVPEKYRNKIMLFGYASEKNRAGNIGSTIANAIIKSRGISIKEKEMLLELARKEQIKFEQVGMISKLIRAGATLSEAVANADTFKVLSISWLIDKKLYEKLDLGKRGGSAYFKALVNKKHPKLIH